MNFFDSDGEECTNIIKCARTSKRGQLSQKFKSYPDFYLLGGPGSNTDYMRSEGYRFQIV
jgi:hypothetical protein